MPIQFSEDKIIDRIAFENPWWENKRIDPRYGELKHREYFGQFYELVKSSDPRRAVVLMGPRRVGKTVMIYHAIQKLIRQGVSPRRICFISLDTPIYTGCLLEELLQLFLKIHRHKSSTPLYLFFDEIQYLQHWEIHLKSLVDSYPKIKLIASGSAAAALKLKSIESGAGRFTDFTLPPLTFREFLYITQKEHLVKARARKTADGLLSVTVEHYRAGELNREFLEYINFGGYPEVSLSAEARGKLQRYMLNDIVEKVLLKDIPSLFGIQNVQELKSFFNYVAYHTGQEFSIDGLASKSGVAKNTIKKYIEYLEASFLVKKIQRVDQNARIFKRDVRFKLYLTNPTLRSALFAPVDFQDAQFGHIAETTAFCQLTGHHPNNLYYARWDKGEIDFVGLDRLLKPVSCLEVKWSNKYAKYPDELKEFRQFAVKNRVQRNLVTTIDLQQTLEAEDIILQFLPLSLFCYLASKWQEPIGSIRFTR